MTPQERLAWQAELDSAMADIDSRLGQPRRRLTDADPQPTLPELGRVELTSELLDEIAWRVAEQLRRTSAAAPAQKAPAPARRPAAPELVEPPNSGMYPGTVVLIRFRWPRLPWPFRLLQRRRRRHPLTTARAA